MMKREKLFLLILTILLPLSVTLCLASILRYLLIVFGSTPFTISTILCAVIINSALGMFILEKRREKSASIFRLVGVWALLTAGYCSFSPLIFKAFSAIEARLSFSFLHLVFSLLLTLLPSAMIGMTILLPFTIFLTDNKTSYERALQRLTVILCFMAGAVALNGVLLKTIGTAGVLLISSVAVVFSAFFLFQSAKFFSQNGRLRIQVKAGKSGWGENVNPEKIRQVIIIASICLWYSFVSFEIYITRGYILGGGGIALVYLFLIFFLLVGVALGFFVYQKTLDRLKSQILVLGLSLFGVGFSQLALSTLLRVVGFSHFHLILLMKIIPAVFVGVSIAASVMSAHHSSKPFFGLLWLITIIAIIAIASAVFLFIPTIGSSRAVLISAGVSALGGLAIAPASTNKYKWSATLVSTAVLCAGAVPVSHSWDLLPTSVDYLSSNTTKQAERADWVSHIIFSEEDSSAMATIATTLDDRGFFLAVNGIPSSDTSQERLLSDYMLGHLPMLLHQAPKKSALIGGVGGGITCGALSSHGEDVYCIEPSQSVLKASHSFYSYNNGFLDAPNTKLIKGDGRHFILTQSPNSLDAITVNSYSVHTFSSANYYSLDFYILCRSRLKDGGVLCQRLSLRDLSENELRCLLATFQRAFPDASLWTAYSDAILVGVKGKSNLNLDAIERKFSSTQSLQNDFKQVAVGSGAELIGRLLLGPFQLHKLHGDARIITDNRNPLQFFSFPSVDYGMENWRWLAQARSDEIEAFVSGSEDALKRFRVSRTASALVTEGWFLMKEGKKSDAVKLFESAIKVYPENQTARRALSEIILEPVDSLVEQGKFSEAKTLVYRALDTYPDNPSALRWMAHQVLQSGDLGYARNLLSKAQLLAPYNPEILGDLAIVLFQLDRREEALDMVQRALLYGQNSPTPYFAMGVIKEFSGERNEAIIYYRKALTLKPDMVEAAKRLEAMGITR